MEGSDTVVVMTKKQAQDINAVFRANNIQIQGLKAALDSVVRQAAYQDTLWKNLSDEQHQMTVDLFKSLEYNQSVIKRLERNNQVAAKLYFTFWAAFVGYLHFFTR